MGFGLSGVMLSGVLSVYRTTRLYLDRIYLIHLFCSLFHWIKFVLVINHTGNTTPLYFYIQCTSGVYNCIYAIFDIIQV